jgi:hypothetical protein
VLERKYIGCEHKVCTWYVNEVINRVDVKGCGVIWHPSPSRRNETIRCIRLRHDRVEKCCRQVGVFG